MANSKIQPFTSSDQLKHHCYTLSTTCTLFKLASEVGPRTITYGDTRAPSSDWKLWNYEKEGANEKEILRGSDTYVSN